MENFLNTKIDNENALNILHQYVDYTLSTLRCCSATTFLDVCLAICVSDDENGTNKQELDIDKFFVADNQSWVNVLNLLYKRELNFAGTPLAKVQRLRIVIDALQLILFSKGKIACTTLCSEGTKKVANLMQLEGIVGAHDDLDLVACLQVFNDLRLSLLGEEPAKEKTGGTCSDTVISIVEQLAKYNLTLTSLCVPEQITVYFGDFNFNIADLCASMLPKQNFPLSSIPKLSNLAKDFVHQYFTVVSFDIDTDEFTKSIELYEVFWENSLLQISYKLADMSFKSSPTVTASKINKISKMEGYPSSVGFVQMGDAIAKLVDIEVDSRVKALLSKVYQRNSLHRFSKDSVGQIFFIISMLVNKKPVSIEKIRKGCGLNE